MTLHDVHRDIGQLFVCGFHGLEPSKEILDLIQHRHLGAIILFSRNIQSAEQVQRLTLALQQAARDAGHERPLLIAVDQENGVVRRLGKTGTYFPGSMALGAINSSSAARTVASTVADELTALGINWNLAPVLDVNNNPLNPVIGVRSFSQDPEVVTRLGLAQIEGYQRRKVATSVKHFPGHGDTDTDSHLGVPVIHKTLESLDEVELVPFKHALRAPGLAHPASVMIAHVSLPSIVPNGQVSSLAPEIVTDILRRRLQYDGVVTTDCLEMDAVKETVGTPAGAVKALQAGNDFAMICHTFSLQTDAMDLVSAAVKDGSLSTDSVARSLKRVADLKDRYLNWEDALGPHDLSIPGCPAHQDLSARLYDRVPTLVRDQDQLLPLKLDPTDRLLFLAAHVPMVRAIESEARPMDPFDRELRQRHANVDYLIFEKDTEDLRSRIEAANVVVIATANANLYPFQVKVVNMAQQLAKRLIVVSVINPYDLMEFPKVGTYLAAYEYTPPALRAVVRVLFNETLPNYHLPVTIPNIDQRPPMVDVPFTIDDYCARTDFDQVVALWQTCFGKEWPLSPKALERVLSTAVAPAYFVARGNDGTVLGFVGTQIRQRATPDLLGQLMLLMVSPAHRCHGIGTALHDKAMDHLRSGGAVSWILGSIYPRFFPGVPDTCPDAQKFFQHRGWHLEKSAIHDLMGDMASYTSPQDVKERMVQEKIWFGRITPSQFWKLLAFQQRYFPNWLPTYQHHADLGDFQDLIVARENNDSGRIIGSLVLSTTHISHDKRSDLIWTDPSLFGERSGSMACVGVASELRGRGIGLGLVAHANDVLVQRGVTKAYVDWVELLGFYGRLGYSSWRTYRTGSL